MVVESFQLFGFQAGNNPCPGCYPGDIETQRLQDLKCEWVLVIDLAKGERVTRKNSYWLRVRLLILTFLHIVPPCDFDQQAKIAYFYAICLGTRIT